MELRKRGREAVEEISKDVGLVAEKVEEIEEKALREVFGLEEWQLQWYRGVSRKTIVWCLAYAVLFYFAMHSVEDAKIPPFDPNERWRVALTALATLLSWITLYFDVWKFVPPEKHDVKKRLLEDNVNGHFSYLTFHIIFCTLLYWNTCLIAEVAWLYGITHDHEVAWARKLLKFTYRGSTLVAAFGVTLAILFLKFNWFEKRWRAEVLEPYKQRGHTWFGPTILFTHLNQTPVALLDMLLIKNRQQLREHAAELELMALFVALYGIYYVTCTHLNFRMSKEYPYPFFRKVLATWKSESMFIAGIIIFINLMTAFMYFLAFWELESILF